MKLINPSASSLFIQTVNDRKYLYYVSLLKGKLMRLPLKLSVMSARDLSDLRQRAFTERHINR